MRQPPENAATGRRLLVLAEPKPGEQRRRTRTRGVAADRLVLGGAARAMACRPPCARPPPAPAPARCAAARRRRRARSPARSARPRASPAARARSSTPSAAPTSPASGSSSPRSSAKSVDLPTPFGPTMPTRCPACTVSEAPSSRRFAPRASVRLDRRSMGVGQPGGLGPVNAAGARANGCRSAAIAARAAAQTGRLRKARNNEGRPATPIPSGLWPNRPRALLRILAGFATRLRLRAWRLAFWASQRARVHSVNRP